MPMASRPSSPYVCVRCARTLRTWDTTFRFLSGRQLYSTTKSTRTAADEKAESEAERSPNVNIKELGPMARRLEEATEETLFSGGRAGRRAVEDAGFSEELKERLFNKVKDAQFRSEHAAAFAEAGMPTAAGDGTRLAASSQPWTGEEATEDAVLRMLNDAHKPLKRELRGRPKFPDLQPVDMRFKRNPKLSSGHRAASAKDKASIYAGMGMKDQGLSDKEKEKVRNELRDRFQPAARALPTTLTGLASLANERIEDAIARGQFRNIPRGKGVERDSRGDNPFIDTTEYIMNKMIKRQDLVPPWIEKQQELAKTAHAFRSRLRNDWKRHASRMIASKGGSLEEQLNRATMYAQAEQAHNPRRRNVEQIAIPTSLTDDIVMVKVREQVSEGKAVDLGPVAVSTLPVSSEIAEQSESSSSSEATQPLLFPFRDPDWLSTEKAYLDLSINNLNTLTRSYNLMAPELAKRGYFSLERELSNCYADVAPLIAEAIRERATRPARPPGDTFATASGSLLDRFGAQGHVAKVYDSKAPHYGFKEMWRDLWNSRQTS